MTANPYLYTKRHNAKLRLECPSMTSERYMEGFDHTNSLINMLVGVANEVARLAISDGMNALRNAGMYRQHVKKLCNETLRRQEQYESVHNNNFGDRLQMWIDYLDSVEEEYRPHIFNIYMSIKQQLDKYRIPQSEAKARVECGRICATMAVAQFDVIMQDMRDRYGADYTPHFIKGRYDGPLHTWTQLCEEVIGKDDDPAYSIDFTHDPNCHLAFDVLSRKLNDPDFLNRIGSKAISMNIDVAKKYATDEDLAELGIERE